jgi:TRAP transporter 4TM/12TM fusion protein
MSGPGDLKPQDTAPPVLDTKQIEERMAQAELSSFRTLRGPTGAIVTAIAVFMGVFHFYVLGYKPIDPWFLRGGHLLLGAILTFALYPATARSARDRITLVDYVFMLMTIVPFAYLVVNFRTIIYRVGVTPTRTDFVMALIAIIAVLEMARRTTGMALPVIAVLFILYSKFGRLLPGMLYHRGYSWERIFTYLYSLDGVFSTPIFVSATYVVLFILFGAFLQTSGAGRFFIDLAFALAGRARGGPAKVAVMASALFGTISGSSAGNVVTTGSFTIPLMKRTGYDPRFAGAVEAVASTGGQIMPPIMGAGAFIMAEILGVPYLTICLAAAIPAILYFAAVYFMVDLEALKTGLRGLPRSELPELRHVLRDSYLFLPVVVLIYMLVVARVSIIRAGLFGIVCCFVVSQFKAETRMGWKKVVEAMVSGARGLLNIIGTCAAAGIIIGVVSQTGLGMKFAAILLTYARGILPLALALSMVVAIILGMGMPTTAAYAIAAAVIAPALTRTPLSLLPIQAHMFVFYFACISAITPPVALASYAGAAIAKARPTEVGSRAFKLGIAAFIVPYMFIYGKALLFIGSLPHILMSVATGLIGIYALAAAMEGWFAGPVGLLPRVVLFAAALTLIRPGSTTDVVGVALMVLVYLFTHGAGLRRRLVGAANRNLRSP